jgi:hypothetical protein
MKRAVMLAQRFGVSDVRIFLSALRRRIEDMEKRVIERILDEKHGNRRLAAQTMVDVILDVCYFFTRGGLPDPSEPHLISGCPMFCRCST